MNLADFFIARAAAFAAGAHAAVGQRRKYMGEPYFEHCTEVANMVAGVEGIAVDAICAALLHDTIEDTLVTAADITALFGPRVAALVQEVSDVSKPEDGNRAARKALDRQHLAGASPEGKTIKLADLISNTRSIVQHDPKFARVYLAEMRLLLPLLAGGDPWLYEQVEQVLAHAR